MEYIKTFEDFLFEKNLDNLFELNESNAYLMNEEDSEAQIKQIKAEIKKSKAAQIEMWAKKREIFDKAKEKVDIDGPISMAALQAKFDKKTQDELQKIQKEIEAMVDDQDRLEDELKTVSIGSGNLKAFFNKVKEIKRDLSEEGISFRIPNVEKYYNAVAQKDKGVIAEIKKLIIDNHKKLKEWKKKNKGEGPDEKGRELYDAGYIADFKIKLFTLIGQQKPKEILDLLEDVYDDFQ